MMRKFNRGITLIALVVTIIVLLILAGISITILTGQNGIINRAQEAKEKAEAANDDEQRKLAQAEALMNTEITTYLDRSTKNNVSLFNSRIKYNRFYIRWVYKNRNRFTNIYKRL